jgi:hypothetical protein
MLPLSPIFILTFIGIALHKAEKTFTPEYKNNPYSFCLLIPARGICFFLLAIYIIAVKE